MVCVTSAEACPSLLAERGGMQLKAFSVCLLTCRASALWLYAPGTGENEYETDADPGDYS